MTSNTLYQTFSLTGTEEILINNSPQYFVSMETIRNYVIKDLKKDLYLNLVDNTSDINKPLTNVQQVYIDKRIIALENKVEQLQTLISNYISKEGKLS